MLHVCCLQIYTWCKFPVWKFKTFEISIPVLLTPRRYVYRFHVSRVSHCTSFTFPEFKCSQSAKLDSVSSGQRIGEGTYYQQRQFPRLGSLYTSGRQNFDHVCSCILHALPAFISRKFRGCDSKIIVPPEVVFFLSCVSAILIRFF